LCGPTHFADFRHPCANQHTARGDEHDFVLRLDQHGTYDTPIAGRRLDGDHALGAPAVAGVFHDGRALAVAVLGGREDRLAFVVRHHHGDHGLAIFERHATYTACGAPHGPDIVFAETHTLSTDARRVWSLVRLCT